MLLPPVYLALRGVPAIVAIVGERIFRHDDAQQDATRPYVTWSVSIAPENTLSETPGIDRSTVTVNCWSPDDAEVEALATLVRDAIEPLAHCVGVPVDNRDRPATKLYRMALQFDWWLSR